MKRFVLFLFAFALPLSAMAEGHYEIVGAKCRIGAVSRGYDMGIECEIDGKTVRRQVAEETFTADALVAEVLYGNRSTFFDVTLIAPRDTVRSFYGDISDSRELRDEIRRMGLDEGLIKNARLKEFYLSATSHGFVGRGQTFRLPYPNVVPAAEPVRPIKDQILTDEHRVLWPINSYRTLASDDGSVRAELAENLESVTAQAGGKTHSLRLLKSEWRDETELHLVYGDGKDVESSRNRVTIEDSYWGVRPSFQGEAVKTTSLSAVAFRNAFWFDVEQILEPKGYGDRLPAPLKVKGNVHGEMVTGYLSQGATSGSRNQPVMLEYQVYGVDGQPIEVIRHRYFMARAWMESFFKSMGLWKTVYWDIDRPYGYSGIHKNKIVKTDIPNAGKHEPIYQEEIGLVDGKEGTRYTIGSDKFIGKGALVLKRVLVPYGTDLFSEPGEAGQGAPKLKMILR